MITLKYFKPSEFNSYEKMSVPLLRALDEYRAFVNTPITITSSYRAQDPGEHGRGCAVDIVFPGKKKKDLFDLFLAASRFEVFNGIGVYPHWQLSGAQVGGLHLDTRIATPRALWMGVREGGSQKYIALTLENLSRYELV